PNRTPRNTAMSTPPATARSASACARCAPSRTCRSRGCRAGSCVLLHQLDEDLLQRILARAQIPEADSCCRKVAQQHRDAGTLGLRVVGVGDLVVLAVEFQPIIGERFRQRCNRLVQLQPQLLLAQLLHSAVFSSTTINSPLLITPTRSAMSSAS